MEKNLSNEMGKLQGHSDYVYSVCFSPDGTTQASGSEDKSIRLWDVQTGQQKANFGGHSNSVMSVCFSFDGTILASGSWDKSIRLWNVNTGQQKAILDGHSHNVNSVCFSPDGTTLASGSNDKFIQLWVVKTGQQKAQLIKQIILRLKEKLTNFFLLKLSSYIISRGYQNLQFLYRSFLLKILGQNNFIKFYLFWQIFINISPSKKYFNKNKIQNYGTLLQSKSH